MQIIVCKRVLLLPVISGKGPKPKQCLSALAGTNKTLQHALRIMKLTAVILLAACLQVTAAGYGQKISLSEKDVPIEKVFKKIQQQTDYKFLYTSQLLAGVPNVTISVRNASVEEVLALCFKEQSIAYEINENTIVIKPRSNVTTASPPKTIAFDPIEVRGVITDENGSPAHGVNVVVKGTSKGTTTNLKGEFVLSGVNENAVLVISSVGYDRQELLVKNKTFITTQLKVAVGNLDELQVIAYGITSKRFTTGNVATIKAADIEKSPVNNPLLALQGRVPGLLITQASGVPGSGVTVRIQGNNSIRGGNDPLFVIDGVPYPSQMLPTTSVAGVLGESGSSTFAPGGYGNPMSYISPQNIESIEILKDADATSIYGSRAANGAILITTKKGNAGKTKLNIDIQKGWGKIARSLKVLGTEDYLEMRKEAFANDNINIQPNDANYDINGLWDQNRYTDWVKTLIGGTAKYTNVQAALSGGNASVQYLFSTSYQKETTVFPGDFSNRKGNVHFNVNAVSSNRKFRFGLTGTYFVDNNQLPRDDNTFLAYTLAPNAPALYNSDGTLNWAPNHRGNSSWDNPLASMYKIYENKTDNLISSANLSYTILPGIVLSTNLGYTKLTTNEFSTNLTLSIRPERRSNFQRVGLYSASVIKVFNIEPQLTFNKAIGKGILDMLLGATIQQQNSDGQNITGYGFATDGLRDIRSATGIIANSTVNSIYKYNAGFGRLNYNWRGKYIVNISARRDGSSRFGPANRFHNFLSAGGAWIFSEENLFKRQLNFLSFGKVKASYGTTGNDQIGDYTFLDIYVANNLPVPYQGSSSIKVDRITNPHLQWEATRKLSIGLELGLLNDRILLTAVYGRNRSSNQLLSYSLPITTGFTIINKNFPATVENTSWEFSLVSKNIRNKIFEWTTSFNLTVPKNKLVRFDDLANSSYFNSYFLDKPLSTTRAFVYSGVDENTGLYQFAAANGGVTNVPDINQDPFVLINVDPKFYGGIQNSIRFHQFQLDFLFQYIKQTSRDAYRFGMGLPPGFSKENQPKNVKDRWRKQGDVSTIQRYGRAFDDLYYPHDAATGSNEAFVDASYARLENLSLVYEFRNSKMERFKINRCKVYLRGQNLLTFTGFGGIDPENRSLVSLAPLRVIMLGAQLGF